MIRTVDEGFKEFLSRLTPTTTERIAGKNHRASIRETLESNFEVYRFFESGSFSHGTGVRGHSDIDAFVTLKGIKPYSSYDALTSLKEVLDARFYQTPVRVRRPAVVVEFGKGYETWEIIPAYIAGIGERDQAVYNIPGPNPGAAWILSAPDEHLAYVNACNEKPSHGNAKALARIIKVWKYFNQVPISSFYLEMRCAEFVAGLDKYIPIVDVWAVLKLMYTLDLAPMPDPTGLTGHFEACSSEASASKALSKLNTAVGQAKIAVDAHIAGDDARAFSYLDSLFGGRFPARLC